MRASFDIKNEESYILAFMGVANADPYYNIEEEMNRSSNFVFRDRIEKGYLEIASDYFGNYICIGIKESNYGKIYFYDHEINRYKLLTQTFEEFLEKIESKKFRVKTIEERIADRLELGLETAPDSPFIKMWQEDIEEYKDYTEELIELD